MYARSTTIQADPGSIDAGIAHLRDEVLPTIRDVDGFVGLSTLVDRDSGHCIVTASWETAEKMHASAEQVAALRNKAVEIMGAGTPQVDEWEIAVMHRDHPTHDGAGARVTWIQADPARVNRLIDVYKLAVLPDLEAMDGFCSASFMVDRSSGRAVGTGTFDSRPALEATRPEVEGIRARALQEMGAELLDVREYELALAHLHVPELA